MHNCKATRNRLVDLALKQTDKSQLPAELEQCAACREEFASMRNALRATDVTMWLAEPAENFWPGYHQRLRARLETNSQLLAPVKNGFGPWLRKLATASIPVIFLTAKSQEAEIQRGLSLGAAGYVTKPFDALTLGQHVKDIVGKTRS